MKHHKDNEAMPKVAVAYVALGRRIEKVDAIAGTTRRYYYDDQRVAVQTLVSGGVETDDRYFVFGNYIDETLLMHVDAADLYYAHDHLYSPVALFAANGTVAERYEYDAYGSVQFLTSNFSPLTSSQHGNPYAFTGRELDTLDAGSRTLMYYRARSYDPETGRFMRRDPLMYIDGMNSYEYVTSSPLNYSDPFGLMLIMRGGAGSCSYPQNWVLAVKTLSELGMAAEQIAKTIGIPVALVYAILASTEAPPVTSPTPTLEPETKPNPDPTHDPIPFVPLPLPNPNPSPSPDPGNTVPPRYPGDGMDPPGDCSPERYAALRAAKILACSKVRTCVPKCLERYELFVRRLNGKTCAEARKNLMRECFKGGDADHREVLERVWNGVNYCSERIKQYPEYVEPWGNL